MEVFFTEYSDGNIYHLNIVRCFIHYVWKPVCYTVHMGLLYELKKVWLHLFNDLFQL